MDRWDPAEWQLSRLKAAFLVVGTAALIGAGVGWVISRITTHLLYEGRSEHHR